MFFVVLFLKLGIPTIYNRAHATKQIMKAGTYLHVRVRKYAYAYYLTLQV